MLASWCTPASENAVINSQYLLHSIRTDGKHRLADLFGISWNTVHKAIKDENMRADGDNDATVDALPTLKLNAHQA